MFLPGLRLKHSRKTNRSRSVRKNSAHKQKNIRRRRRLAV
jgi:hypothetical protein